MTSEGCVSALGLRDELITAAFARNFGLRFRLGDVSEECARHVLITEGCHG